MEGHPDSEIKTNWKHYLDDIVTVNYAKFQGIEVRKGGKKASKLDLLGKI